MDKNEEQKIRFFLGDKIMSDAVYKTLLKCYLKKRDGDVYTKAAERIAIDLLNEAWKDLESVKLKEQRVNKPNGQVGL